MVNILALISTLIALTSVEPKSVNVYTSSRDDEHPYHLHMGSPRLPREGMCASQKKKPYVTYTRTCFKNMFEGN